MPDAPQWHTTPHSQAPDRALVLGLATSPHVQWLLPQGAGDGSGNGDDEMPLFDLTLYQGTVQFNPTNDPVLAADMTMDETICWYAQWGKVVEFKFRAVVGTDAAQPMIPSGVALCRLHGLGLFNDDYHEMVSVQVGTVLGTPDNEVSNTVYPAQIRMVNPGDWRDGYDFILQMGFQTSSARSFYVRGATTLTSAMFFRNGECILDDPEYVTVGPIA